MNLPALIRGSVPAALLMVAFMGDITALTSEAATYVYVSKAPEQQIQIYRLNPKSGELAVVESLTVGGSPGCLSASPDHRFLYASLRSTSRLASFRLDNASGKLAPVSTASLPAGENAAFVTTDHSGRWLLSASYIAGTVVIHRLGEDGTIEQPAIQSIKTAKTAHCVAIDRNNKLVLVPHVAPNAVFQFQLNEPTGKLTELGTIPGGVDKAGPRHLAFHPNQRFAYTSDEQGSSITSYQVDPATGLSVLQTVSTLPSDFKGSNSTAEVKVHPSGKFAWVSNRGHDSLAGFSIDGDTGRLTSLGQTPTEKTPRSFELDPTGNFLIAGGEGNGRLAVYRIDTSTGALTPLQVYEVGQSVTWVRALELKND